MQDLVIEAIQKRAKENKDLVKSIILFGSRAKGTHTELSDYDIAIEFQPNYSTDLANKLILDFSEPTFTLHKIDLVILNNLSDIAFKERIYAEGIKI